MFFSKYGNLLATYNSNIEHVSRLSSSNWPATSIKVLVSTLRAAKEQGFTLSKILFSKMHLDPATDRILTKIGPFLKQLGYDAFLEELPAKFEHTVKESNGESHEAYQNFVAQLEKSAIKYKLVDELFDPSGLNLDQRNR